MNEHGESFPRLSLHYLRRYGLFKSIIIYIGVHLSIGRCLDRHRKVRLLLIEILYRFAIHCPFVCSHPMWYPLLSHISHVFSVCDTIYTEETSAFLLFAWIFVSEFAICSVKAVETRSCIDRRAKNWILKKRKKSVRDLRRCIYSSSFKFGRRYSYGFVLVACKRG